MNRIRIPGILRVAAGFAPGVAVPAIATLVAASIFTRTLTPEAYGRAAFVLAATLATVTIATQWLQQATLRYLPVVTDASGADAIKRVVAAAVFALLLIVLPVGSVFLIGAAALSRALPTGLVIPAAVLLIAAIPFHTARAVLQAELQSHAYSALQSALALVGLAVALAWNVQHRDGSALIWGPAAGTVTVLPFIWKRAGLPVVAISLDRVTGFIDDIRPMARYGTPMVGWFIAATSFDLANRYVIDTTRGAHELGIYSASFVLMAGAATVLGAPLNLALHPHIMRTMNDASPESSRAMLARLQRVGLISLALAVVVTVVAARPLSVLLLGAGFREGFRIFPILVAGAIVWQLAMFAHKPLEYRERTGVLFAMAAVLACINFLLNLILVPRYGYGVAPYVTAACYTIYFAIAVIASRRVH